MPRSSTTKAGGLCRSGKFIERADKTSRILDLRYQSLPEKGLPKAINQTEDARMVGRAPLLQRVGLLQIHLRRGDHPRLVAEFLLLNEDFPRSIRFCVGRA